MNLSFISSNYYSTVGPSKTKKDIAMKTIQNFPKFKDSMKSTEFNNKFNPTKSTDFDKQLYRHNQPAENQLIKSVNVNGVGNIQINNYYNMSNTINMKNFYVNNPSMQTPGNYYKKNKYRGDGCQYKTQPNLNINVGESK